MKTMIRKFNLTSVNILLSLILLMAASSSFGAKKYSRVSGNWTTGSNWVGGVAPVANDTVFVLSQHTMSVSANLYSNSTYMFVIVLGTLDMTNNGKLRFNSASKVIIETGGRILGDGSNDLISIGTASAEYDGSMGMITGPSYIGDGHTPVSGEGTAGCGCYSSASVAQCSVTSSNGYTVHVLVWAQQIVVETSPCTWGYNYDVKMSYNISFSPSMPAGGLYTLQGNIFCGSSSLFFDLPNTGGSGTVTSQGNAWRGVSDCATATPQSLNCLNAAVEIHGLGIASQTCGSTLPIKLMGFEGKPVSQGAQLAWMTSMERNFDYFQIERAQDDLNFMPIAKVSGKGGMDINVSYSFLDSEIKYGKNYYRLKIVDHDGTYEYSELVFINWSNGSGIVVYPNPIVNHKFTIELNDYMDSPADVQLLNQFGQVVYQSEVIHSKSEIQLPENIESGLYYLRISSGMQQEVVKVVIQ